MFGFGVIDFVKVIWMVLEDVVFVVGFLIIIEVMVVDKFVKDVLVGGGMLDMGGMGGMM